MGLSRVATSAPHCQWAAVHLASFASGRAAGKEPQNEVTALAKKWNVYEDFFKTTKHCANPYTELEVNVVF